MFRPTELHQFLDGLGAKPKKGLSQNFLIDGNITQKIVQTAELTEGDQVLEIGPGPGSLTQKIISHGAKVIAVEKDPVLAQSLNRLNSDENQLTVYCEDIMKVDLQQIIAPLIKKNNKLLKVIANLPYHLTTPILILLVTQHDLFSRLVLMVQEEVARRYTSKPNCKEYGSITLFLQYHANVKYSFKVSKNCFYPKPSVESAVVSFDLRKPPYVSNEEKFFEMTRTAFKQRRKMLRSSLSTLFPAQQISESLLKIGKNPESRPENLSLEEFIALFESLKA